MYNILNLQEIKIHYTRSYMHEVIIIVTCCYCHTCILKSFKEKLVDNT